MKNLLVLGALIFFTSIFTAMTPVSAECVDDGNNTASAAVPIDFICHISDVVCPDDPFDYYILNIPAGAYVLGGAFWLESEQAGTVLRISGDGGTVWEDATTDSDDTLFASLLPGDLSPGNYYFRVTHYGADATEHHYEFTFDIIVRLPPGCEPDGNDDGATADDFGFGETVSDWVCDTDHVDVYSFVVSDSATEGSGSIILTAVPGELLLYIVDSAGEELHRGRTAGGRLEYDLDSDGALTPGTYYLAVFLPLARDDENSYTLNMEAGSIPQLVYATEIMASFAPIRNAPWPTPQGKPDRAGRSTFNGPGARSTESRSIDLYDELGFGPSARRWQNKSLLVGQDGWIYFINVGSYSLFGYNLDSGLNWRAHAGGERACLDTSSNVYFINGSSHIESRGPDGTLRWSNRLPQSGTQTLLTVGTKVYVSTYEEPYTYVTAYNKDGTREWNSGPLRGCVFAASEDYLGSLYIMLMSSKGLYKLNPDGTTAWFAATPEEAEVGEALSYDHLLGPIVCRDRRIFLTQFHEIRSRWFTKYGVYNNDGSLHMFGDYGEDIHVYSATYGGEGRIYKAIAGGSIKCFDNFNNEVWSHEGLWDRYMMDMAMGADNTLYAAGFIDLHADGVPEVRLYIMDHTTGNILASHDLNIPVINGALGGEEWATRGELAIGEGRKLIYLHDSGHLSVITDLPWLAIELPANVYFELLRP